MLDIETTSFLFEIVYFVHDAEVQLSRKTDFWWMVAFPKYACRTTTRKQAICPALKYQYEEDPVLMLALLGLLHAGTFGVNGTHG